jgi:dolichol-phosphate mannosyltransferase
MNEIGKKLFIVVPTYNEKENIKNLLRSIKLEYENNNISGGVIVVDDNSPDGTAKIVEKFITKNSTGKSDTFAVHLIQREGKLGLGTAYITGFKEALSKETDYILEMDADFSHDPKYIKEFYNYLSEYDVVIGSRYVKGGGVEDWGTVRKMISRIGSLYSKLILWWGIKDATAGFVGYKSEVLKTIPLDEIQSNGYSFQVEMKYFAYKNKFKIKEFPILFPDRVQGKSKMNKKIVFEAIAKVLMLRFR